MRGKSQRPESVSLVPSTSPTLWPTESLRWGERDETRSHSHKWLRAFRLVLTLFINEREWREENDHSPNLQERADDRGRGNVIFSRGVQRFPREKAWRVSKAPPFQISHLDKLRQRAVRVAGRDAFWGSVPPHSHVVSPNLPPRVWGSSLGTQELCRCLGCLIYFARSCFFVTVNVSVHVPTAAALTSPISVNKWEGKYRD